MHLADRLAWLVDMDGVLYHGGRVLPGALAFADWLCSRRFLFLTNNPSRSPEAVVEKLVELGFPRFTPAHVLTSGQATAQWLHAEKPGFRFFSVGAPALREALSAVGCYDEKAADFVVVGEGAGLDFESLTTGINLLCKRGARLLVTNPDVSVDDWVDGAHRLLPGGGALVAPFAVASGQRPVVIGKPEPLMFRMAAERLGVAAADCVMLGDRPDTDIAGAVSLGMFSVLVRSGRFGAHEPWPAGLPRPGLDLPDLPSLLPYLQTAG